MASVFAGAEGQHAELAAVSDAVDGGVATSIGAFARVQPFGGLIAESPTLSGTLAAGGVARFAVELDAGQSFSAIVTTASGDGPITLASGGEAIVGSPGETVALFVPAVEVAGPIEVALEADGAADYEIRFVLNADATAGYATTAGAKSIDHSRFDLPGGGARWAAVGTDTLGSRAVGDVLTLDLTDFVGQAIDAAVVVEGVSAGVQLELIAPDGTPVAAGVEASYRDGVRLEIRGVDVAQAGVHTLRVVARDGGTAADYRVVVTAGVALERAPISDSEEPRGDLGVGGVGLGHARFNGDRLFAIREPRDRRGELVELDPETYEVVRTLPLGEGTSAYGIGYDGSVVTVATETSFFNGVNVETQYHFVRLSAVDGMELGRVEAPPAYSRYGTPVAIYDGLVMVPGQGGIEMYDAVTGVLQRTVPMSGGWDYFDDPAFAGLPGRGTLLVIRDFDDGPDGERGRAIFEIDAYTGEDVRRLAVLDTRLKDSLYVVGGRVYVGESRWFRSGSSSVRASEITVFDLETGQRVDRFVTSEDFADISADGLVASMASLPEVGGSMPAGGDRWTIALEAGQATSFQTATPFDGAGALPGNDLNLALVVADPNGVVVAVDDNSAVDGRNAALSFIAGDAGVYVVQVIALSGEGEYVLMTTLDALIGDFNGDDVVDAADVEALQLELRLVADDPQRPLDPAFDLTSDGAIDMLDLDHLVYVVLDTVYGDANLDGRVDTADLAALAGHFGVGVGWSQGDFDGDGVVGTPDLAILAGVFGHGTG
ncbi:MAG: dockerin type I domain-containing protein [Planctomycetota bacterium]